MTGSTSLFAARRRAINHRAHELEAAGAERGQAYVLALEEAWRTEARENERLWDQADEIQALRDALRPFAQRVMAETPGSGLDTIGIYVRRGAVRDAVAILEGVVGYAE